MAMEEETRRWWRVSGDKSDWAGKLWDVVLVSDGVGGYAAAAICVGTGAARIPLSDDRTPATAPLFAYTSETRARYPGSQYDGCGDRGTGPGPQVRSRP